MAKYYAVKKGRKIGIFSTWEECESMVKGFKGALYKSFSSLEDVFLTISNMIEPLTEEEK